MKLRKVAILGVVLTLLISGCGKSKENLTNDVGNEGSNDVGVVDESGGNIEDSNEDYIDGDSFTARFNLEDLTFPQYNLSDIMGSVDYNSSTLVISKSLNDENVFSEKLKQLCSSDVKSSFTESYSKKYVDGVNAVKYDLYISTSEDLETTEDSEVLDCVEILDNIKSENDYLYKKIKKSKVGDTLVDSISTANALVTFFYKIKAFGVSDYVTEDTITDEWVQKNSSYTSVDELRNELTETAYREKCVAMYDAIKSNIVDGAGYAVPTLPFRAGYP